MVNCDFSLQDTSVGIWNRERLATVLYKAVKHEDVEIAAKCLKLGIVDVNTRFEPVRNKKHFIQASPVHNEIHFYV